MWICSVLLSLVYWQAFVKMAVNLSVRHSYEMSTNTLYEISHTFNLK